MKQRIFLMGFALCFIIGYAFAAPTPIIYYKCDTLDKVVVDESGAGNDGTPMGALVLSDDGKDGKSFEFNGTDTYIDVARVVQDNFTLMAWIKGNTPGPAGTQAYQGNGLFWSDVAGVANDFILGILERKLSFFCGNPDTSVTSDTDVIIGEWVHVAAIRDMDNGKIGIYINGKEEKTIDHANKTPLNAQPRLHIGANTLDRRYYTGLMDEIKVFDTVLTEAEIAEAMQTSTSVEAGDKFTTVWAKVKAQF